MYDPTKEIKANQKQYIELLSISFTITCLLTSKKFAEHKKEIKHILVFSNTKRKTSKIKRN